MTTQNLFLFKKQGELFHTSRLRLGCISQKVDFIGKGNGLDCSYPTGFGVVDFIRTKLSISTLGHFVMLVDFEFDLVSDIVDEMNYVRSHA